MPVTIERATRADADAVTALAMRLFPGHAEDALLAEMAAYIEGRESAVFLAMQGSDPAGFAQCGLRHDYVEGSASSPVGYLEGVYVDPACRRAGTGARLVRACEAWARAQGCREFASDCTLENEASIAFHRGVGFREAGRLVCFIKPLAGTEDLA